MTTVTQFPWIKLLEREGGNRPWWPSAPPSSGWIGLAFNLKEFWGQMFESRGLRRGMAWPSGCLLAFPCEPHSEPAFTECSSWAWQKSVTRVCRQSEDWAVKACRVLILLCVLLLVCVLAVVCVLTVECSYIVCFSLWTFGCLMFKIRE